MRKNLFLKAEGSVCSGGTSIWVANQNGHTVTKLNAGTGAAVGTYNVGSAPVAIGFDGAIVWVANRGDATVTKL